MILCNPSPRVLMLCPIFVIRLLAHPTPGFYFPFKALHVPLGRAFWSSLLSLPNPAVRTTRTKQTGP